jgi:hypothetical protein
LSISGWITENENQIYESGDLKMNLDQELLVFPRLGLGVKFEEKMFSS